METEGGMFICILLFSFLIKAMATLNPGQYPAKYNFGDSNSDTGAMSAAFFPEIRPFGNTYFNRPSGRACDGRLLIDFIANKLGYPLLSGYLDSIEANFRRGANFATTGALVRRVNESFFEHGVSPFPLDIQIEQFIQFKERSSYFYKKVQDTTRLPVPEEFANALYIIDIGQIDIAFGFAANQTDKQIVASIPDTISQIASAINKLYQLGARTLWIHNTGPIGCLPISIVNLQNPPSGILDPQGCIKSQNDVALEFNKQLKDKIAELRTQLNELKLTYVDIYAAKYGLISNASSLGFKNPSTICCGYYVDGVQIPCGTTKNVDDTKLSAGACSDPSKVISWDGVHYTEATNSYVANQIFSNTSLSDPPI